jgi:hypothetical protein
VADVVTHSSNVDLLRSALADRYRIEREELGDHEAAVKMVDEAIAAHDVWMVQFPNAPIYDRLRKDPRAAAMLDQLTSVQSPPLRQP